jgi:hypothetical protein
LDRDVLLVGSAGLSSAEEVVRTAAGILGGSAPRLPDGEAGWARSAWIQCRRPFFLGNPAPEMVEPDPDRPREYRPARVPAAGIYGHTLAESYRGRARLRPGVSPRDGRFDALGYADWAEESYAVFARLKSEGVIPSRTRFQVSLPTPSNIVDMMVLPEAQPLIREVYEAAFSVRSGAWRRPYLSTSLPSSGTAPNPSRMNRQTLPSTSASWRGRRGHRTMSPPVSSSATACATATSSTGTACNRETWRSVVGVANGIVAGASRLVAWVHMPMPRDQSDEAYVSPPRDLRLPATTHLYRGLVHYTDGLEGTRTRIEVAGAVYPGFGIAAACASGRRVGRDMPTLLRIHARAATLRHAAAGTT